MPDLLTWLRGLFVKPVPASPETWGALLDRDDVLLLDTETNGLSKTSEIIEIGIIDTTGKTRFSSLIMPRGRLHPAALEINGITLEMLAAESAPAWPAVHKGVKRLLDRASVVIAWNAPFDRRMIEQTVTIYGLPVINATWRDAMTDYRVMRPGQRYGQIEAMQQECVPFEGTAHRAVDDCKAMLDLMRAMA